MLIRKRFRLVLAVLGALGGTVGLHTGGAAVASPVETWTIIERNVTSEPQFFEDELCGRGGITETFVNKLQMQHLTANTDGTFHFVDFETGHVVVDFDDPAYDDIIFRNTETFHANLSPGETLTIHENLRQSDGDITFVGRYHLTVVNGGPVVERQVELFSWSGDCS